MPPYLPAQPGYDPLTGLNTGNLGFMTLPIERTIGGYENNVYNPNANPYPGGFTEDHASQGLTPDFNPFLQGYMSGGEWKPYLPDKIVIGSRNSGGPTSYSGGTQWINGKEYNIGANNYEAGQTGPKPYQFGTAPGDERMEADTPFAGFHFGQVGQPGYRFAPGTMEGGKFYSDQPGLNPTPDRKLGTFQPWNPAAAALQQYRSQP